jgi:hypothetical protein
VHGSAGGIEIPTSSMDEEGGWFIGSMKTYNEIRRNCDDRCQVCDEHHMFAIHTGIHLSKLWWPMWGTHFQESCRALTTFRWKDGKCTCPGYPKQVMLAQWQHRFMDRRPIRYFLDSLATSTAN